jgi:hypothetical protein
MRHLIALVAGLIAGAAPAQTCGTHCGTERWTVKTLTDADRSHVTLTPVATTVNQLRALATPVQRPADARVAPTELTTFTIHAVLIGWKLEGDRDFHLVIADPATPSETMIAEVPSSTCDHVCSSGHVAEFRAARAVLIAKLGNPKTYKPFATPIPVTITGVGFFDFLHHQTGVAPNAVELHPVLTVAF